MGEQQSELKLYQNQQGLCRQGAIGRKQGRPRDRAWKSADADDDNDGYDGDGDGLDYVYLGER